MNFFTSEDRPDVAWSEDKAYKIVCVETCDICHAKKYVVWHMVPTESAISSHREKADAKKAAEDDAAKKAAA